ncbi:Scarecrow-like protein 4 [Acorus calamus]|uniref:Scarecrow-like protein 4 n=1 Tax=Acorus calamus TaxID=4465 RepID=A0AAV9CWD0_ACOCL|nr:Scarecrow-like protein 4 [Acorus calamus]KAK1293511.1 Scarecrow-like protein 4 [Acorus calamus]
MDDTQFATLQTAIQSFQAPENPNPPLMPPSSLELIRTHHHHNKPGSKQLREARQTPERGFKELSTEEVLRLASARFIQSSAPKTEGHPFGFVLSNLTRAESRNVELAELLLSAAEKVGNQQYDRAETLLKRCEESSPTSGNPVERVVHYFARALRSRIEREEGRGKGKGVPAGEALEAMMSPHPLLVTTARVLPFCKVIQFTAMQAIIDGIGDARRVHAIDLGIQMGVQWPILMEHLASRRNPPCERLVISAVTKSETLVSETRRWLASFAESLSLPFSFNPVIVSDMGSLKSDMFTEAADAVVVYSSMILYRLIVKQEKLVSLLNVLKTLNPRVMAVAELETSQNSTSFVARFVEALFYYSAFFDALETFMGREDGDRRRMESEFFGEGIRSVVAVEGEERIVRKVRISVWRSFFGRFRAEEVELNRWAEYQAGLIVGGFGSGGRDCTIEVDGKALIVGWKGTPLASISAWKFR